MSYYHPELEHRDAVDEYMGTPDIPALQIDLERIKNSQDQMERDLREIRRILTGEE